MPGTVNLNPSSILYDENGNPVGVILDGSVYRLQTETKLQAGHGLATETTLSDLEGKDFATETTLDALRTDLNNEDFAQEDTLSGLRDDFNAEDFATETTLDALHTDFNNEDFAQETTLSGIDTTLTALEDRGQENMAGSLPVVVASDQSNIDTNVHDGSGNAITSQTDGSKQRLHTQTKLAPGQSIIIGNTITPDLSLIARDYVKNGSSSTMKVDGSVTPVVFTFNADATYDIELYELRFIFGAQDILFDGNKFASKAALTNGILIEVIHNGGSSVQVANIQINEDFLMFPTPANYLLNNTGPKDILVMGLSLGGAPVLEAGTSDKVQVTVRDDLDEAEIATLKAQVFGIKV